jgi:hypothetical protein
MLNWLIVVVLLAIALYPITRPSAVAWAFLPMEAASYPFAPTDFAVVPTVPGLLGTPRALVGTICPKPRTRATTPRWRDAAGVWIAGIVPDLRAGRSWPGCLTVSGGCLRPNRGKNWLPP